jgi:hypothetical protein
MVEAMLSDILESSGLLIPANTRVSLLTKPNNRILSELTIVGELSEDCAYQHGEN